MTTASLVSAIIINQVPQFLLITVLTITCYTLLKWYRRRCELFRTIAKLNIPGPPPTFWLGNLRFANRDYVRQHMDTWFQRYGDIFGYYRGDRPVVVLRDLNLIYEVFVKRFVEFPNRLRFIMDVHPFSSSVLALRDKRWRHVRRIITPAFTAHKVAHPSVCRSISTSIKRVLNCLQTESKLTINGTTTKTARHSSSSSPSSPSSTTPLSPTHIVVDRLQHHHGIGPSGRLVVNVNQLAKAYTLDVVSSVAFDMHQTDVFEPQSSLMEMVEEFMANCDGVLNRLMFMFPFLARLLELINNHLTSGRMVDLLVKHLKRLIELYQVKEHLHYQYTRDGDIGADEDSYSNSEDANVSSSTSTQSPTPEQQLELYYQKKNVLDYMLLQGKIANLTQDETIGNLLVILFAGYETTACCLAFTMFNLARNVDIQDRLRNELLATIGVGNGKQQNVFSTIDDDNDDSNNDNGDDTNNHRQQTFNTEMRCELLDRVIYETLRLYPPVIDYVIREISGRLNEVHLSNGVRIPDSVAIQFPVWSMHHDASIWPNPYQFDPSRPNLPIPGSKVKNYAFAAFGIGQRCCIGGNLAMAEMRQLLASLLLRYRFELITDPRCAFANRYRLDANRMLEVETIAELIKPKSDIYLQFVPIINNYHYNDSKN